MKNKGIKDKAIDGISHLIVPKLKMEQKLPKYF